MRTSQLIIELMIFIIFGLPHMIHSQSPTIGHHKSAIALAREHVDIKLSDLFLNGNIEYERPGRTKYHIRLKIGANYKADTVWLERIRSFEKNDSIIIASIKTVQFDSIYFKDKSVLDSIYYKRLNIDWIIFPEDYEKWNIDPYH